MARDCRASVAGLLAPDECHQPASCPRHRRRLPEKTAPKVLVSAPQGPNTPARMLGCSAVHSWAVTACQATAPGPRCHGCVQSWRADFAAFALRAPDECHQPASCPRHRRRLPEKTAPKVLVSAPQGPNTPARMLGCSAVHSWAVTACQATAPGPRCHGCVQSWRADFAAFALG